MESTVTISTEEYNRLRDFKSAIERNDTIITDEYNSRRRFITNDATKDLLNQIGELKEIIRDYENPLPKETTLHDVKGMSIFRFLKWKCKK